MNENAYTWRYSSLGLFIFLLPVMVTLQLIRIQVNPTALSSLGINLEDVRTAVAAANVNQAKGSFDGPRQAFIIGANDVVNPAALDDPSSPVYGMPIIRALDAKNIIVMKRGAGKGYAGIENYLFFNEKTRMLFGNAKDTLQTLANEIKQL